MRKLYRFFLNLKGRQKNTQSSILSWLTQKDKRMKKAKEKQSFAWWAMRKKISSRPGIVILFCKYIWNWFFNTSLEFSWKSPFFTNSFNSEKLPFNRLRDSTFSFSIQLFKPLGRDAVQQPSRHLRKDDKVKLLRVTFLFFMAQLYKRFPDIFHWFVLEDISTYFFFPNKQISYVWRYIQNSVAL